MKTLLAAHTIGNEFAEEGFAVKRAQIIWTLGLGALIAAFFCLAASAASQPALDALRIPDKALRKALEDATGRAPLTGADLRDLGGRIDLSGKGIRDCAGLEQLVNVTSIDLSDNEIVTFDQRYVHGLPKDINLSRNAKLTAISDTAFSGCASLRSLVLPDSLRTIGDEAFMNAPALQRVEAPGASKVGRFAFFGAPVLDQIALPALVSVGDAAFGACPSVTGLSLPIAETIGASALTRCTALRSVDLPKATSIGAFAFQGCVVLGTVSLPSATKIGASAFADCAALERIDFAYPCALDSVGKRAFPEQRLRICFLQGEVEVPATRVPHITPALAASAGQPNWQLYAVNDETRLRFDPATRKVQLALPENQPQESRQAVLLVPTNGFLRYEFIFELWPPGTAVEKRSASRSDALPATWSETPLPSASVPPTGQDDKIDPRSVSYAPGFLILSVLLFGVSLAFFWKNRTRL